MKRATILALLIVLARTGYGQIETIPDGIVVSFDTKIVRGAPYSAIAETETGFPREPLSKMTSRTVVHRDAEGRTRREFDHSAGEFVIAIFDPVDGYRYMFGPRRRVAFRSRLQAPVVLGGASKRAALPPSISSLGTRVIEGLACTGTRKVVTYPLQTFGNAQPFRVVNEEWYSPELQVNVLAVHEDPRIGVATYRLTHIEKKAPDPALFRVPAGYEIKDRLR